MRNLWKAMAVVSAAVSAVGMGQGMAGAPSEPPLPRPAWLAPMVEASAGAVGGIATLGLGPERTVAPLPRPASILQAGRMPKPGRATRKGMVCGVKAIKGRVVAPVPGRISGCGVANPVRIESVSGVRLSQAAIMDCPTAQALNTWVRDGVFPAVGRLGGGPVQLRVAAHYACRTRNNKPGGKISEHGKGRAIDISGITLKNGREISVLKGWRAPVDGPILKKMHRAACGPFGTVLGPDGDRYHQDHFHFDTARYRGGPYCR